MTKINDLIEQGNKFYVMKLDAKTKQLYPSPLTNFVLKIEKTVVKETESGDVPFLIGKIYCGTNVSDFQMEKEFWLNNDRLKRAVSKSPHMVRFVNESPKNFELFREAVEKFSTGEVEFQSEKIGWVIEKHPDDQPVRREDGSIVENYWMPSVRIDREDIHLNNQTKICSSQQTRVFSRVDLKKPVSDIKPVLNCIVKDLLELAPHSITYCSVAHVFLSPFSSKLIDSQIKRYVLFIYGESGTGKTFLADRLQRFFGKFPNNEKLGFTSTFAYNMAELGLLKDVFVLIDDYKKTKEQESSTLTNIIHSYTENLARGRLSGANQGFKNAVQNPPSGNVCITGERRPQIDPSDISRCLILEVNPTELKSLEERYAIGKRILAHEERFPEVMADYIHWAIASKYGWTENLEVRIEDAYSQITNGAFSDNQMEMRILNTIGINFVSFCMFISYLEDRKVITQRKGDEMKIEMIGILRGFRDYVYSIIKRDSPEYLFVDSVSEAIISGKVEIKRQLPEEHILAINCGVNDRKFKPIIGFFDGEEDIYLLRGECMKILYSYVRDTRNQTLTVDEEDILKKLERTFDAEIRSVKTGKKSDIYIVLKAEVLGLNDKKSKPKIKAENIEHDIGKSTSEYFKSKV